MSEKSASYWLAMQEKSGERKFAEKDYAETSWPVFEPGSYELRGTESSRYIKARRPEDAPFRKKVRYVDPLSPEYAGLFLEFARWFDAQEMEKAKDEFVEDIPVLDTTRNAEAALAWARKYGVLGLDNNPDEQFGMGSFPSTNSSQIAAERLSIPEFASPGMRAYKKSYTGGPLETVEAFVLEAYEANIVLKLYEAAVSIRSAKDGSGEKTADVAAIERYIPDRKISQYARQTEREMWSEKPELARAWALGVVENAVNRKVEDVYPVLFGEPDAYEPGWGFKSLLGGVWFQMRRFMLAQDNVCEYVRCGKAFVRKRRDQRYCSKECRERARSQRDYHNDRGSRGKTARRQKRIQDIHESWHR